MRMFKKSSTNLWMVAPEDSGLFSLLYMLRPEGLGNPLRGLSRILTADAMEAEFEAV